jgi:hypothetical protein
MSSALPDSITPRPTTLEAAVRARLQAFSAQLLAELHASDYFRRLTSAEREDLDRRLVQDAADGHLPLLPRALDQDLQTLNEAFRQRHGTDLPGPVRALLTQVDGFSEGEVCLYAVDPGLLGEDPGSRLGLLDQNARLRRGTGLEPLLGGPMPQPERRYLIVGDDARRLYAFDLVRGDFCALDADTFRPCGERFIDHLHLLEIMLERAGITAAVGKAALPQLPVEPDESEGPSPWGVRLF